jgi:20S proteasome subunit alpha 2
VQAKGGVIIATEKKLPLLTDESSVNKIEMLTDNIGVTYSGMGPDFRLLVKQGRNKAQNYYRFWKEPIPVNMMAKEMANIMQEYTQSGYVGVERFLIFQWCTPLWSELVDLRF